MSDGARQKLQLPTIAALPQIYRTRYVKKYPYAVYNYMRDKEPALNRVVPNEVQRGTLPSESHEMRISERPFTVLLTKEKYKSSTHYYTNLTTYLRPCTFCGNSHSCHRKLPEIIIGGCGLKLH